MIQTLLVATLLLAGIVAGILSAGVLTVRPALDSLSTESYIVVKQAFGRSYPRVMKPLQLATVVVEVLLIIVAATDNATWTAIFAAAAAAASVANIVITIAGELPINNAMMSWSPARPPAGWESQTQRWDNLNEVRTAASVAALILLSVAAITWR